MWRHVLWCGSGCADATPSPWSLSSAFNAGVTADRFGHCLGHITVCDGVCMDHALVLLPEPFDGADLDILELIL